MREFKEQFSYDRKANSRANVTTTPDDPRTEARTEQHYKDDCDINVIIKRFGAGAKATPQDPGFYTIDRETDYQQSLNFIDEGKRAFLTVPAELRARFDNNPSRFIEYMRDEKNHEEARRFGILPKIKAEKPMKVEVVPPPEAPAKA